MPTPAPDDFTFSQSASRGPASKYDWAKYADGRVWVFTKGDDFVVTAKSFRTQAYNYGHRNNISVRTSTIDGGEKVIVQFNTSNSEEE